MKTETESISLTSYFFLLLLTTGAVLFALSFFVEDSSGWLFGLRQIALGFTLIGLGEWVNHPLQKSLEVDDREKMRLRRILHRKRNPSSLGNLMEIGGLILLFTGVADYI